MDDGYMTVINPLGKTSSNVEREDVITWTNMNMHFPYICFHCGRRINCSLKSRHFLNVNIKFIQCPAAKERPGNLHMVRIRASFHFKNLIVRTTLAEWEGIC